MKQNTAFSKFMVLCAALLLLFAVSGCVFAAAVGENSAAQNTAAGWSEALCSNQGGVLAVSYRGDTTAFSANTPDAVAAAADAGADLISVLVTKTADGQFVLLTDAQAQAVPDAGEKTYTQLQTALFGAASSQKAPTLAETAEALAGRAGLILDFDWNDRAALVAYLRENALTDLVLLRAKRSARDVLAFYGETGGDVRVLGVYGGNVVMHANSYLKRVSAAGLPLVQYQNKNYFCVSFQAFTTKRFSVDGNCRAMVDLTQKDRCGQRTDSVAGWDDMISRGFSVLETGNIAGLRAYLAARQQSVPALESALLTAEAQPLDALSAQSEKALETAIAAGKNALLPNASLSARQAALSALQNALGSAVPRGEKESKKGALQITTGKVLTVLFCAVLVLAAEIFFYRMQERKKGEEDYVQQRKS